MPDESKTCTRCGKEKPLAEFCNSKTYADGKYPHCQICTYMLPDEVDRDEFIKATYALSNQKLAEHYGLSQSAIERWKTGLRKQGYKLGTVRVYRGYTRRPIVNEVEPEEWPEVEPAEFPESTTEDYVKYEVLHRDRLLVFGDWHVPYHDLRVLDMVYRIAERFGVKSGLLNGDILDNDLFSPFPKTHPDYHDYVKDELSPVGEIIKIFLKVFDDLHWLEANHERRLNKRVGGHFTVWQLMEKLLGCQYSQYSYAYVESGGEEILITHPKNYRKVPGSLPIELCTKYLKNVLCGHVHRLCLLHHQSGKFWAVEGGCCADTKKMLYKMKDIDLYGMWNPGFVMIIDGWPHLIEPRTWDMYVQPFADIEKSRREGPTEEELAEMERHKQALMDFEAKHGTHR